MLKLKEEFKKEVTWFRKVKILETYHLSMGNEIRETAEQLEISIGYVSEALTLAKALDKYPGLHAKSRSAAIRFVRENS